MKSSPCEAARRTDTWLQDPGGTVLLHYNTMGTSCLSRACLGKKKNGSHTRS